MSEMVKKVTKHDETKAKPTTCRFGKWSIFHGSGLRVPIDGTTLWTGLEARRFLTLG